DEGAASGAAVSRDDIDLKENVKEAVGRDGPVSVDRACKEDGLGDWSRLQFNKNVEETVAPRERVSGLEAECDHFRGDCSRFRLIVAAMVPIESGKSSG